MNLDAVFDLLAIVAGLVALSYTIGVWRMVRSPSRVVLVIAVVVMVATRVAIVISQEDSFGWVVRHRSMVGLPVYVLLALAFALTYYELRDFHFDVPKNAEDRDTEAKHVQRMRDNSKPMKEKP